MKKRIDILTVLIVILLSFVFISCSFWDIPKATTENKTITSSTASSNKEDVGSDVEFEYGDNFTKEDIEFVKHLQTLVDTAPGYVGDIPDFSQRIDLMNPIQSNETLYKVKINIDEEPYFICAYVSNDSYSSLFSFENGCAINFFVWYKFNDFKEIPNKIDGNAFVGAYAIYDCIVENDILNEKGYNYQCKYFIPLSQGYFDDITNQYQYELYENIVIIESSSKYLNSQYLFIQNWIPAPRFKARDMFGLLMKDGIEYFVLHRTSKKSTDVSFDLESQLAPLGSYYTEFLPYVEVVDAVKETDGFDGSYLCIKLNQLINICFKK